jgi:hypothetical protein
MNFRAKRIVRWLQFWAEEHSVQLHEQHFEFFSVLPRYRLAKNLCTSGKWLETVSAVNAHWFVGHYTMITETASWVHMYTASPTPHSPLQQHMPKMPDSSAILMQLGIS